MCTETKKPGHLPEVGASPRPGTAAAPWHDKSWGVTLGLDFATVCSNPLHLRSSGDYTQRQKNKSKDSRQCRPNTHQNTHPEVCILSKLVSIVCYMENPMSHLCNNGDFKFKIDFCKL